MFNRQGNNYLVLIISIILAVTLGIISYNFIIPGIVIGIWIAFALSVAILFVFSIFTILADEKTKKCICKSAFEIVFSSITAIILTIISLLIPILTASIPVAILYGLITFFFIYTLLNFGKIILCFSVNSCRCREE